MTTLTGKKLSSRFLKNERSLSKLITNNKSPMLAEMHLKRLRSFYTLYTKNPSPENQTELYLELATIENYLTSY